MSTHTTERKSAAPSYPDAYSIGPHLVIDPTEWLPDRGSRPGSPAGGRESYYRCLSCGAERRERRRFPDVCDGPSE